MTPESRTASRASGLTAILPDWLRGRAHLIAALFHPAAIVRAAILRSAFLPAAILPAAFLSGCAAQDVEVVKTPPNVESQFFDAGVRTFGAGPPQHNECANTNWYFQCFSKFEFDVASSEKIATGYRVGLRIKKVHLKLDLPITKYLPEKATERVLAHEDGHVKICLKAYENAEQSARQAANGVIGKVISGKGKTLEQACQIALREAGQAIGREYRAKTVDRVNVVSALYDQITSKRNEAGYVDTAIAESWSLLDRAMADGAKKAPQKENGDSNEASRKSPGEISRD